MTINFDLFNAILAMDSYNRGYDEGIILGTEEGVTTLGNALIISQSDIEENSSGVNIGFYALAYSYNGGTIISFRGTDDVDGVPNPLTDDDVFHGWSLGAGNINSEQAQMAIRFYQAVAGDGNWQTANISLTGHSLGGGLAGFVGANDNKFQVTKEAA